MQRSESGKNDIPGIAVYILHSRRYREDLKVTGVFWVKVKGLIWTSCWAF